MLKVISLIFLIFLSVSCSTKKNETIQPDNIEAKQLYSEALKALEDQDYFFASKKFAEAEVLLPQSSWAAKSALMSGYCLYSINFYDDAILTFQRFIKTYPASKNIDYANYLIAISYYEQILDEKKDLEPLLLSKKTIETFLKEYPNTDYAIDLQFKLELIINQLAAKGMSIARYYIKTEKWIAAINRLKVVVKKYNQTIFIEEALYRLVEIYHRLGLEEESRATAVLLGYNYASSEWYKRSYAILNKNYRAPKISKENKEDGLVKRTLKKILFLDGK